jgi:NAD(P)-dependent dehydrogenase (short-subunit alcohol dehydrogenase family)
MFRDSRVNETFYPWIQGDVMKLADRVIIVTGASRGIGAASARHFAEHGAKLVLVSRSSTDLERVADGVRSAGGDARICTGDVTDPKQCLAVADYTVDAFGRIDGLFNNAAAHVDGDAGIVDTPYDAWRRLMVSNLDSVFLMSQAVVPRLIEAGGGSIVNNASMVAHMGSATPQIAYCAAKGGVVAMSREMAIELASKNIRVNAISPGPVNTVLHQTVIDKDPEYMEHRLPHLPMKRLGEEDEIASVAGFLLSDEASYLTGQSLLVDGGITAAFTT